MTVLQYDHHLIASAMRSSVDWPHIGLLQICPICIVRVRRADNPRANELDDFRLIWRISPLTRNKFLGLNPYISRVLRCGLGVQLS